MNELAVAYTYVNIQQADIQCVVHVHKMFRQTSLFHAAGEQGGGGLVTSSLWFTCCHGCIRLQRRLRI